MAAAGEVDVITGDDGEARYRRCSGEHHHHLVCRRCGLTVEVAGPAVESWAESVAAAHGFAEPTHTLEIFGVCPGCSAS
jgi:Fur family ferric uptake transcriptional regulator